MRTKFGKRFRTLVSVLLTAALVLTGAGTAFAAGDGTVTGDVHVDEETDTGATLSNAGVNKAVKLGTAGGPYTITFNPDGGTVSPATLTTDASGKAAALPTPVRDKYIFKYWQNGSSKYYAGDSPIFSADTTLTAVWEIKLCEVICHGNGGTVDGTDPSDFFIQFDRSIYMINNDWAVERKGCTFEGWYDAAAGGTRYPDSFIPTADTMEIYAHWTKVAGGPFTVTLDPNGGTVSKTTFTTDAEGYLSEDLPDAVLDGAFFHGWYDAKTGGKYYAESGKAGIKTYTADTKLYAHWDKVTDFTCVTFNFAGGTWGELSGEYSEYYKKGTMFLTVWPLKPGYVFAGWYDAAAGGNKLKTDYTTTADTLSVYAHWTADPTYDSDSGDDSGNGGTHGSGSYRDGWNLIGNSWYCYAGGSLKKGWYKDPQDNRWYYLDPVTGEMLTGWQFISGNWYYLNPSAPVPSWGKNADGNWVFQGDENSRPLGSMYGNEDTPDGFHVNADGKYVK